MRMKILEDAGVEIPNEGPTQNPGVEEPSKNPTGDPEGKDYVPEFEPQGDNDSDDKAEDDESVAEEDECKEPHEGDKVRRSACLKAGVRKPVRYAMHMKLKKGPHNDEATNEQIAKAEREELELVFRDLKAVEPLAKEMIPLEIPAYKTHLFTVEKFKADGTRDKSSVT
jgi:hypothetical protein